MSGTNTTHRRTLRWLRCAIQCLIDVTAFYVIVLWRTVTDKQNAKRRQFLKMLRVHCAELCGDEPDGGEHISMIADSSSAPPAVALTGNKTVQRCKTCADPLCINCARICPNCWHWPHTRLFLDGDEAYEGKYLEQIGFRKLQLQAVPQRMFVGTVLWWKHHGLQGYKIWVVSTHLGANVILKILMTCIKTIMFTFIPITFLESTVKVRQSHKKTAKNIWEQKRDNRLNFLLARINPNWCSRVN